MIRKKKIIWGMVGVILVVAGVLFTIPLSLNEYFFGLIITGMLVIVGILLVAWVLIDEQGSYY